MFETIRRMLSAQVYDVVDATRAALQSAQPDSTDAVRHHTALVRFSPEMAQASAALKKFLMHNLYRHPQVLQTTQTAQQVVRDLFEVYSSDATQMSPPSELRLYGGCTSQSPAPKLHRVVADYIAGMTDRFATKEHERLKGRAAFRQSH